MKVENYVKALNARDVSQFVDSFSEGCTRCSLSEHDNHPVILRGNTESRIMLLGESPGAVEDQCGKPFSGPAGQLLDNIFKAIGLDTNEMLLSNVTYCRPVAPKGSGKQNYTPKESQVSRCIGFTNHLIEIVNPKIIIACGGTALKALSGDPNIKITEHEGKWIKHKTGRDIFCMIHPASVLYQSSEPEKQRETKMKIWNYMQNFRDSYKSYL